MRISDWSSDVCSSDLGRLRRLAGGARVARRAGVRRRRGRLSPDRRSALSGAGAGCKGGDLLSAQPERVLRYRPRARLSVGWIGGRAPRGARGGELRRRGLRSAGVDRSEEHTSELQALMRISYYVVCLEKKN